MDSPTNRRQCAILKGVRTFNKGESICPLLALLTLPPMVTTDNDGKLQLIIHVIHIQYRSVLVIIGGLIIDYLEQKR